MIQRHAITIGTNKNDSTKYYDYQVIGNVIEDYGLGDGKAHGIFCYSSFIKGKITIKDNIMHCNEVDNFIIVNPANVTKHTDINLIVEGNQLYAEKAANNAVELGYYNSLVFTNNSLNIKWQLYGKPVSLKHHKELSSAIVNFNNITCGNIDKYPFNITNKSASKSLIYENNVINGELIV